MPVKQTIPSFLSFCIAVCATLCAGCGSADTSVLGPTDTRCSVELALDPPTIGGSGGTGTLSVSTARECPWSVSASGDWLRFTGPTSGQGPGSVPYSVAPNRSVQPRATEVSVAATRVTLSQQPANCSGLVTPTTGTIGADGGTLGFTLSTEDFCPWTASSPTSWITIAPPVSGTGSAEIGVRVASNPGPERVGTADIFGTRITITQQAAALPAAPPRTPPPTPAPTPGPAPTPTPSPVCTYTVAPLAFNSVDASGTSLDVIVTANDGCTWTASSNENWIAVVSGSTGTGSGQVRLSVLANSGAARSGTATIAGQAVTVNQLSAPAQACAYSIAPTSYNATPAGGSVNVAITTTTGCVWSVSGLPSWISATPTSGTGSGTATLTIQANTSGARTANILVANQTFAVNQAAAPCAYAINPTTFQNVPAIGGVITVGITTIEDCEWKVSGAPGWIVATPSGGSGPGSVVVTVAANPGAARTATFQIAKQDFTVSQLAGPCTYSVSPASIDVSSDSQTKTITVTTQTGCPVTATADVSWIHVDSTPPPGGGAVTIGIEKNNSRSTRTGNVIISGQTVKVTQQGRD